MVMRWNEGEEGSSSCVVDGVVIVCVDGVDGVVVFSVFVLGLLAHGSLVRSCGLGVLAVMVTEVSCSVFPMHVSAACVCTVPDVDACTLSPIHGEKCCQEYIEKLRFLGSDSGKR